MPNNKKKLLITGSKGMLGWALTAKLASEYQLTGIDIEDADITDKEQIQQKIQQLQPDIIIHAAAYTDVDGSEANKELAFKINAAGTENIAQSAKLCRARLIYISTDFVFDGTKKSPYVEEDIPNPINTYGKTKLEGEKHIQAICPNHLIIRTAWLYGPHGKNFVNRILELSQSQEELRIVNDQTGSPTYSLDLAEGIGTLLETDFIGIIHLVNNGTSTWYELAKKTLALAGKKTEITPVTSKEFKTAATRPLYSVLSTARFQNQTKSTLRHWPEALTAHLKNNL